MPCHVGVADVFVVQVITSVLSNELFKAASFSEWDLVHLFKTVADMGSIDHARRAAAILTRGTRLIPSDPKEGLKYYLQAAAGGALQYEFIHVFNFSGCKAYCKESSSSAPGTDCLRCR
jgi:hypothetical protein